MSSVIRKRIDYLRRFLYYCQQKYFLYNESIIKDEEYDLLMEELENLIKKLQESGEETPPPKGFVPEEHLFPDLRENTRKIAHCKPMLSLQKIYDPNELEEFLKKSHGEIIMEMKIDGMSVALTYDKGLFVQGATRGDGKIGEDITAHIMEIKQIPLLLSKRMETGNKAEKNRDLIQILLNKTIEIRGELYLKNSVYKEFFPDNIHPRNICAGVIRKKYPDKLSSYISFFAYGIIGGGNISTQQEVLQLLEQLGFPVEPNYSVITSEFQLRNQLEITKEKIKQMDYECDGVVFKTNNIELQESMGYTTMHPRGAVAFKFANKKKSTFLRDVQWNVGLQGKVTPVGHIQPVTIEGVSIKKVTLHNYDFLKKLSGINIMVERAGGVIPKAINIPDQYQNLSKRDGAELVTDFLRKIPTNCPSCRGLLQITGKELLCTNYLHCPKQKLGRLINFCQKLKLYGIGEAQMQILISNKLVNSYVDIFTLAESCKGAPAGLSPVIWHKFIRQVSTLHVDKNILKGVSIAYGGEGAMGKIVNILWENPDILDYSSSELHEYLVKNKYFPKKTAQIIASSIVIFHSEIKGLLQWIKGKMNQLGKYK